MSTQNKIDHTQFPWKKIYSVEIVLKKIVNKSLEILKAVNKIFKKSCITNYQFPAICCKTLKNNEQLWVILINRTTNLTSCIKYLINYLFVKY